MSEQDLAEESVQGMIQANAMALGCSLMRNNSGCLLDENRRPVRFGLGNQSKAHNEKVKSSDLIGFTRLVITPDMVGRTVAIFTAVEVKRSTWKPSNDKREKAQRAFIDWIVANGGFAGFAESWTAFQKILGR